MIDRLLHASRLALVAALAIPLVAGCGSGAPASGSGSTEGTGSLRGDGGSIVAFVLSTSNVYIAADAEAMKTEGKKLGYDVTVIANQFDQTEEDQQVRQFLASGKEADAFVYWPANNDAGVNSARLLSRKAPVFQMGGALLPKAEEYVTAVAGQDNEAIGRQMGENLLSAIEEARSAGATFHGAGGTPNVLEITYMPGAEAGIERSKGWTEVAGDQVDLIATEHVPTPDAQGGFTVASQVLPKYRDRGVDMVVVGSNDQGVGVVKAMTQNGLTPGEDVTVVVGDFSGDKQPLLGGQIHSAVLQSPVIEGRLMIRTAARYLSTGKVADGTEQLEADATEPEVENTPPSRTTIMPSPPITPENVGSLEVWGMKIDELEP